MDQGFLGTRWGFDLQGGGVGLAAGRVVEATGEEAIRQSIWMILSTAPGERVGRPDFGCGIHDLVFAPQNAGTMGAIIRAVENALTRWEPRIDVLDVDAAAGPEAEEVLIAIQYRIRATNSRLNLVYPFYLST